MNRSERNLPSEEFELYDGRGEAFENLYKRAEALSIIKAPDVSVACDKWVELLFRYEETDFLSVMNLPPESNDNNAEYHRETWKTHGFSNPTIRSSTLHYLDTAGLFTDPAIKTFLGYCLFRAQVGICERDELVFRFSDYVAPGRFPDQETALEFLHHLADISDEMKTKNIFSIATYGLKYKYGISEAHLARFRQSHEGNKLATFSTISVFTKDDTSWQMGSNNYMGLARIAFQNTLNDSEYQEFLINRIDGVKNSFWKWDKTQG